MPKARAAILPILVVAIIQALTYGLLIWNDARLIKARYSELWQSAAQEHSTLLAQALAPSLAVNNRGALLDILELLKNNHALSYAAIFNSRREMLASLGTPPPLAQDLQGGFRYRDALDDGQLAVEKPIVLAGHILGLVQIGYAAKATDRSPQQTVQTIAIALTGLLLTSIAILVVIRTNRGSEVLAPVHPVAPREAPVSAPAAILDQASRRLPGLLESTKVVAWEADPANGQFCSVSASAERLLGYPAKEWLEPDFCKQHVHPDDLPSVRNRLTGKGITTDSFSLDFRIFSSGDDCLWLRMLGCTQPAGPQGNRLGGLLLNISGEKLNEQRLAYLADHDPLTGLINRRCFEEKLEEQLAYSRRYNASGTLLLVDLDQAKHVSDTYGHPIGDRYLRQAAQHLRDSLRETDVVSRFGDNVFGILLIHTLSGQAILVSNALLKMLSAQEFTHDGRRIPFSACIGVALFPKQGDNASDLLSKADSALRTAKQPGSNTYRLFTEGN